MNDVLFDACILTDRTVLTVSGEDRLSFLQGLVTSDIRGLSEGEARFAALLSPQGKILFEFFVVNAGNRLFLDCAQAIAAELLKRLSFYKLRAKVAVEDASREFCVGAAQGGSKLGAISYADPRFDKLGTRFLAAHADAGLFVKSRLMYDAVRVVWGVPEGGLDYAFGDVFPHDACLDLLHGVDFHKGCYVGQEVVSRMYHRRTGRTRVLTVRGANALPSGKPDITANGFPVGKLGSVAGRDGIALCRIDRVGEALADGGVFTAGDVPVTLAPPSWANYSLDRA